MNYFRDIQKWIQQSIKRFLSLNTTTMNNMNFSAAITQVMAGKLVRRSSWPDQKVVFLLSEKTQTTGEVINGGYPTDLRDVILNVGNTITTDNSLGVYSGTDRISIGFTPTLEEILATDWETYVLS